MSIKITYSNKTAKPLLGNTVVFVDDKFNLANVKKFISNTELNYIKDLLQISDLKKNILVFEVNSKKKNYLNFC